MPTYADFTHNHNIIINPIHKLAYLLWLNVNKKKCAKMLLELNEIYLISCFYFARKTISLTLLLCEPGGCVVLHRAQTSRAGAGPANRTKKNQTNMSPPAWGGRGGPLKKEKKKRKRPIRISGAYWFSGGSHLCFWFHPLGHHRMWTHYQNVLSWWLYFLVEGGCP